MSIISTEAAVPARLEALIRTVSILPKGGVSEEDFLHIVWPKPLRQNENSGVAPGVLNEAIKLGIIGLSEEEKLVIASRDQDKELPDWIFERCCQPSANNTDVVQAMAFVLQWVPDFSRTTLSRLDAERALAESLGVAGQARVDMLEYWAEYFGFARLFPTLGASHGKSLVPDATVFLERHLTSLGQELGTEAAYADWRTALGRRCTAWDGAPLAEAVRRDFRPYLPDRPENQLAVAESIAWLRLRERGRVRLNFQHDARRFVAMAFGHTVEFTHIEIGGQ